MGRRTVAQTSSSASPSLTKSITLPVQRTRFNTHLHTHSSHNHNTHSHQYYSHTSNSNTLNIHWGCHWRNPIVVFCVTFAILGTLRFRVRTKEAASNIIKRTAGAYNNKLNNNNNNNKFLLVSATKSTETTTRTSKNNNKNQTTTSSLTDNNSINETISVPNSRDSVTTTSETTTSTAVAEENTMQQNSLNIEYVLVEQLTQRGGASYRKYAAVIQQQQKQQQTTRTTVTVLQWARAMLLLGDGIAVSLLLNLLREAPYSAIFWELPAVTSATVSTQPMEFVVVDAPSLHSFLQRSGGADPNAFDNQFRQCRRSPSSSSSSSCTFSNLGGDATLIAPLPPSYNNSSAPILSPSLAVISRAADAAVAVSIETTPIDNNKPDNIQQQQHQQTIIQTTETNVQNDTMLTATTTTDAVVVGAGAAQQSLDSQNATTTAAGPNNRPNPTIDSPPPPPPVSAYAHLANFVRTAPPQQVTETFQNVAKAYLDQLNQKYSHEEKQNNANETSTDEGNDKLQQHRAAPVWLSTSGMGVAWLHFRLDSTPKYYSFDAYRNPNYWNNKKSQQQQPHQRRFRDHGVGP